MSAHTMAEAFAPAEAAHRARIMGETWGHLAPKPSNIYTGTIMFAHSEYGDLVPLRTAFDDAANEIERLSGRYWEQDVSGAVITEANSHRQK